MKKILFLLFIFICSYGAYSQKENKWSVELGGSSYTYLLNTPKNYYNDIDNRGDVNYNKFNYESYFLVSKYFSWIKLSTGIMYSTKNLRRNNSYIDIDNNYLYKVDYNVEYLKVPILASVGYSFNKIRFNLIGGFIFDKIINYRVTTNYFYEESSIKNYHPKGINISVRGAIGISTEIFNNVYLNIYPFIDYKIDPDNISMLYIPHWGTNSIHDYYYDQIPNGDDFHSNNYGGLISIGLNVGFEYKFH